MNRAWKVSSIICFWAALLETCTIFCKCKETFNDFEVSPLRLEERDVDRIGPQENYSDITNFLDQLFFGYDKRVRPNFGVGPVQVICDVFVSNIDAIAEATMEFGVTVFVRRSWNDRRLGHSFWQHIPTSSELVDRIWVPDVFFANEKRGVFHDITVDNTLLRIDEKGNILYSQRISLTLNCHMQLKMFPMDVQICEMQMESFGYTTNQLFFEWREGGDAVQVNKNISLPQFEFSQVREERCDKIYITGNFTCIKAEFVLTRQLGYYLLNTYIPSFALVVLSWVGFWMTPEASAPRVSLGATTVLTTVTQSIGVRATFAKVSYITAIDVWMATCMVFVIASVVEFSIVNFLSHIHQKRMLKSQKESAPSKFKRGFKAAALKKRPLLYAVADSSGRSVGSKLSQARKLSSYGLAADDKENNSDNTDREISEEKACRQPLSFAQRIRAGAAKANNGSLVSKENSEKDTTTTAAKDQDNSCKEKKGRNINFKLLAVNIDRTCRYAFPAAFGIFNTVHWAILFI